MFERCDELETFAAVAETGRIIAAADRLGMTRLALTRTIARLWKEFRGKLFKHIPNGVHLTRPGAGLRGCCQPTTHSLLRPRPSTRPGKSSSFAGQVRHLQIGRHHRPRLRLLSRPAVTLLGTPTKAIPAASTETGMSAQHRTRVSSYCNTGGRPPVCSGDADVAPECAPLSSRPVPCSAVPTPAFAAGIR